MILESVGQKNLPSDLVICHGLFGNGPEILTASSGLLMETANHVSQNMFMFLLLRTSGRKVIEFFFSGISSRISSALTVFLITAFW